MSRTKSWYLEQHIAGQWHLDERPWYPPNSPIDLNFFSDKSKATEGLSLAVNDLLETITHHHFPHDPSFEVDALVSKQVSHAAEELLELPIFGWVMAGDILNVDWSIIADEGDPKRDAIYAWLQHLDSLGEPSRLRLVFMLW